MPLRRAVGTVPAPAVRLDAVEKHVTKVRTRALAFARALRKPPFHPETVHRLRTHLRRLQAYAEFLQRPRIAARLADCVSWLSDLRTLYVFQQFLRRRGASVPDRSRMDVAVRDEEWAVARAGYPEIIRTRLAGLSVTRMRRPAAFLAERFATLSRDRAVRLDTALRGLSPEATRKELHRLRLLIKSLRYQAEIALEAGRGDPRMVAALKRRLLRPGPVPPAGQEVGPGVPERGGERVPAIPSASAGSRPQVRAAAIFPYRVAMRRRNLGGRSHNMVPAPAFGMPVNRMQQAPAFFTSKEAAVLPETISEMVVLM